MSTKRRQSASGGARKKLQGHSSKFRYELVRYSEHGDLCDLTEEELLEFKSNNASFVAKYLTDSGAADATWQSQCRRVLESIMVRSAAPPRHDTGACPPAHPPLALRAAGE